MTPPVLPRLLAALCLAWLCGAADIAAAAVTGAACNPAVRVDNPSCVRPGASGLCRRVGGNCGALHSAQCLDDPNSGKATKNLPGPANRACVEFCKSPVGQCEPVACNNDSQCAGNEACTQGWCQPASRPASPATTAPANPARGVTLPREPAPRVAAPDRQKKVGTP